MKKILAALALATVSLAATIENGSLWSGGGGLKKVEIEFREVAGSNPVKHEWRVVVWDEDQSQPGEWTPGAHIDEDGNLSHTDGSTFGPNGNEIHARRHHPSRVAVNSNGQRVSYRLKKYAPKPGVTQ